VERIEDAHRRLAFLEEVPLLFHAISPCAVHVRVWIGPSQPLLNLSGVKRAVWTRIKADQSGSKGWSKSHGAKAMEQKPWFLSVFIRFDPRQMLSPDGRFTRAAAPVRA
jgi:hypothetical protein